MSNFPALRAANAPLNAFLDFDESAARGVGPLSDLSIGIKANIMTRGLPWTGGMELFRHRIADRDAEVVKMLRSKGAAILGTLNMEEAALGSKTDNPWYGPTHNPHRPGFSPGGSSGGSGAAVAAGLCDAALGTDTMGSVRIPAALCGVYGFKPAPDAVSQDGLELCEPFLDAIGPLARDLITLRRVAAAMSDVGDALCDRPPVGLANRGGVECSDAVRAAYERGLDALGVTQMIALPHSLSRVRFAGFIRCARYLHTAFADADPSQLSERFKRLIAYGPRRSDADWADDCRVMDETADALRSALDRHGVLLLPSAPGPALPLTAEAPANQADFTCLANMAALPALAIPAGFADGLPIGLQLVGRRGFEAGLFEMASRLDSVLQAYRPPATFGF